MLMKMVVRSARRNSRRKRSAKQRGQAVTAQQQAAARKAARLWVQVARLEAEAARQAVQAPQWADVSAWRA